jgi:hypothetical protein
MLCDQVFKTKSYIETSRHEDHGLIVLNLSREKTAVKILSNIKTVDNKCSRVSTT